METEFFGEIEHRFHFVGAIAVDMHANVALEYAHQGFLTEVTPRRIAYRWLVFVIAFEVRGSGNGSVVLVPFLHVGLGPDKRGAITGDIAHARGRATLLAVDAFGIFTTGHFQAPRRSREFHSLVAH